MHVNCSFAYVICVFKGRRIYSAPSVQWWQGEWGGGEGWGKESGATGGGVEGEGRGGRNG